MVASPPKPSKSESAVSRVDHAGRDPATECAKKTLRAVRREAKTKRPSTSISQESREEELDLPPLSSWYGG